MNRLRNLFIIGFYNILMLCSLQLLMIALKCLLIVTMNHSWSQNCYCGYFPGNFIISRQFPQERVYLMRQEMQTIISSLVILHYNKLFHPNLRRCLHGTTSFVVVKAAYLPKLFIQNYYHGVIFI